MALPEGRLALLCTKVEGSIGLSQELGDVYLDLLDAHDRTLRAVWAEFAGVEVETNDAAFFVVFTDHPAATMAAAEVVRRCRAQSWPGGVKLQVRIALHSGTPRVRGRRYWGVDVHYAARLCSAGHGGQVILSAAMRAEMQSIDVDSLGEHRLKDFAAPREIFHLVVDGSRASHFPRPRTLSLAHSNLPTVPSPIIGRDDVVSEVVARLTEDRIRLITITGPGGVGKTRVALAVGEQLSASTEAGIVFVPLAGVQDLAGATLALAEACGFPARVVDVRGMILEHLGDLPWVLIFDNAEHLTDLAGLLGALMTQAPGVRALVTSQVPLHLRGEHLLRLAPLDVPPVEQRDPAAIMATSSVELFVNLVRSQHPDFPLTEEAMEAVGDLCRTLDGLPLALELAASRAPVVGIERLAAALKRDEQMLGTGAGELPDRQRGLHAALTWTVSLLSDQERLVFVGLGAFAGPWQLDWAEVLFDGELDPAETWDALIRLSEASLVSHTVDGRFTMAERVRQHARGLLAASGRERHWRRRHAELLARSLAGSPADILYDWHRLVADAEEIVEEVLQAANWTAIHDHDALRELLTAYTVPLSECVGLASLRDLMSVVEDARPFRSRADALFGLAQMRLMSLAEETLALRISLGAAIFECLETHGTVEDLVHAGWFQIDGLKFGGAIDQAEQFARDLLARPEVAADERLRALVAALLVELQLEADKVEEAKQLLESLESSGMLVADSEQHIASLHGDLAFTREDFIGAISWYARALRAMPANAFHGAAYTVQTMAVCWAQVGADDAAVELLDAVRASFRTRTGLDIPVRPAIRDLIDLPYERLDSETLAVVRRRARVLDYVGWRALALELASEYGADTAAPPDRAEPELSTRAAPAETVEIARLRAELAAAKRELEASRNTFVRASDAERQRLSQDLHDGAQQRLVALGMALRLAQLGLDAGTVDVNAVFDAGVDEISTTLAELRQLGHGLRPAALTEGLRPALVALTNTLPIPVRLSVSPARLPDEITTTAYFVVAEAITNVAKYSGASTVEILVERTDAGLEVVIRDDGRGGAVLRNGSGLAGLAARVATVGGTFRLDSPADVGTTIVAVLPCGS